MAELEKEFAFSVDGEKFYYLKDESEFMKMPRWESISRLKEIYQLRFTPDNFQKFLTALDDNINKGQLGMLGHLVQEARARSLHLTNVNAMYQFSAQYFLCEDENPRKICPPSEVMRKIDIFKKKDLLDFIQLPPIASFLVLPELLKEVSLDVLPDLMKKEMSVQSGLNHLIKDYER